ncbi:MAG: sigma-70 family RNA polymerase sigma factor [Actinomycetia bacterium]|nr:sigma-70 family RNA polymerase sigma factor [Actinomycetes bacterium]
MAGKAVGEISAPAGEWGDEVASSPVSAAGEACRGRPRYSSPEALFIDQRRPLVRALTLVCGDPALAEDSVQEAFARLCLKWKRISEYDDPAAWVYRVGLNLVRDHRRNLARRARLVARLGGESGGRQAQAPVIDRDPVLWAAVRALPGRQKTAVALYYLADLKVAEVAGAMGISEGAVKRHLDRARETLRTRLEVNHER